MQQPYQQQNMSHSMHRNQPRMLLSQQRQSHLQSQHNQMQPHHIPPHSANTMNPPHSTSLVHGSQAQNTLTQPINVASNPALPQNLMTPSQTLQQRPPQPPAHVPQAQVHIQSQQKQVHQQNQNSLAPVNAQTQQQTDKPLSQTSPTAVPNDGGTAEGVVGKDCEILPSSPSPTNLANSKEKTPMCLVNELARFNKIKHQYRLTSETGPPHQKVFTVTLRLGDSEEYTAQGTSIKRAQHAAAREALKQTCRPSPPPKQRPDGRHTRTSTNNAKNATGPVMPTVELNALAMKICEPAVYTPVQSVPRMLPPSRPQPFRMQPALVRYPRYRPMYPNGFNNRFQPGFRPPYQLIEPAPMLYRVQLAVGARCYQGEGATPQAARHDAAAKALAELKLTQPEEGRPAEAAVADDEAEAPVPAGDAGGEESDADLLNLDVKSPVSLVHELALKLNLTVTFGVKFEKGPPHMKVFITTCTVGDLETEGEGNGKKVSKKRAAEKMLAEMRKLWPPVVFRSRVSQFKTQQRIKRKHQLPKRKTRNLIKENTDPAATSDDPTATDATAANPISVLAQARQAARARSPQYRLLEERRANNTRKFVVECAAGETRALGAGPNKKAAKRNAAENVLTALGINTANNASTTSPDNEPATSPKLADGTKPRKVTFSEVNASEGNSGGSAGRQLVPGLLLMQENYNSSQQFNTTKSGESTQTTAMITIAKELLRAGSSPTAEAIENQETSLKAIAGGTATTQASAIAAPPGTVTSPAKTPGAGQVGRPKEQLMYLAQLLGFQVQFTDFPKGNHREFLSLVSLSTEPPLTCHGGGASTESSHDQAARAALEMIAHMGLDNVAAQPHGDGIHVVSGGVCAKPGLLSNGVKQ